MTNWKWRLTTAHDEFLILAADDTPPEQAEPLEGWLAVAEFRRYAAADVVAGGDAGLPGEAALFESGIGEAEHAARLPATLYDALLGGMLRAYRRSRIDASRSLIPIEEATADVAPAAKESNWIEIELVDMEDNPVGGEPYRLTLPDGSVAEGSTSADGAVYIPSAIAGQCKLTFPKLDQQAWELA